MNAVSIPISKSQPRRPLGLLAAPRRAMARLMAHMRRRSQFRRDVEFALEPQLSVLAHRRAKFLWPVPGGAARIDRWANEIDHLIRSAAWPASVAASAGTVSGRRRLRDIIDSLVRDRQQELDARCAGLPSTSRFDSHWAD